MGITGYCYAVPNEMWADSDDHVLISGQETKTVICISEWHAWDDNWGIKWEKAVGEAEWFYEIN